jgi:hypothetical protein
MPSLRIYPTTKTLSEYSPYSRRETDQPPRGIFQRGKCPRVRGARAVCLVMVTAMTKNTTSVQEPAASNAEQILLDTDNERREASDVPGYGRVGGIDDPVVDPTDPETDFSRPDDYDLPANVGYRLGGRGATRVLIGPNGQVLSNPAHEITVHDPGQARTKVGAKTIIVRWQPDLREVDAYDRQHDPQAALLPDDDLRDDVEVETDAEETATTPIRGYGSDGEPLAASDTTRRSQTLTTTSHTPPRWRPRLPWWILPVGIIVLLFLAAMYKSWQAGMLHL